MSPREHLQRAISILGTQEALATACGVKQPYVHNWLNRDKKIPLERAFQVEKATNGVVTKEQLRPDIFQ